ncbi:MAG: hypothetical protein A2808_00990 [Candidatus Moranbacteria bacterium RIFCSPHIGHO2_01_FULL_55_24]|nr:MAG: hypothetical protein A2808_00990 [Candidatus Moranbacteria bacterium RIFCSPHIGHO2_01_FULL_55_24]
MPKLISIVIPVYNEEKNVPAVAGALRDVLAGLSYDYEIIFVNDGSRDNSLPEICRLSQNDARIKGIDFSRNFGKEAATSAGCHAAAGDAVITMDADLQHPPALIPELIRHWEDGAEVVYTVRKKTKGINIMKKITSSLYYWMFKKMSSVATEPRSTDFRLMDKKVIEMFRRLPERGRMFRGLIDWMGFKRQRVEFDANERLHGKAGYSYQKLFRLAMNSFTSFSLLPLKLAGYLGLLITFFSGLLLLIMLAARWGFNPHLFTPLSVLATINIFLVGIVLISLGFIALYIARIHDEVIDRPLYIVREKINLDNGMKGE